VVVRSQEAVLAGLARGECDGILPDEWLEPDNLVQSALEEGFLDHTCPRSVSRVG
jgi:hypothetical protein